MVIQAIALLDTLDKDVNTFVMRVREWYSWHFPELVKIVADKCVVDFFELFLSCFRVWRGVGRVQGGGWRLKERR